MYVNTSDAARFAELQDHFGVPEISGEMIELFGCYMCDSPGYWSYNPRTTFWRYHGLGSLHDLFCDVSEADRGAYRRCVELLGDLAPPTFPSDRSIVERQEPFLYMGFKFQWLFIPDLQRWELLPLGRHEPSVARDEAQQIDLAAG